MKQKTNPTIIKGTAVAYYRYSSAAQNESSIETQQAAVRKYCDANGIKLIDEYIDREKSGRAEHLSKRTAYLQMKDDLFKGKRSPEFLMLYKLDRLGRDSQEVYNCFKDLSKIGIKVKCVSGSSPADVDDVSAMFVALIGAVLAETEDAKISERTVDGNATAAKRGQYMGAYIPFGYAVKDKRFVLDENNHQYARQIFTKYMNGESVRQITDWLNTLEITTSHKDRDGKTVTNIRKFQRTAVTYILHNPFYYGCYQYKSSSAGLIELEDNHPAIVSKDEFKQVQAILATHTRAPKAVSENVPIKIRYLLSGKIFCGECGSTMQGMSGKGGAYRYYSCKNKRTTKECAKAHIHKDWIENYVVNACINLANEYDTLPHEIEILFKKRYGDTGTKQIEKEIEKQQNEINSINKALRNEQILAVPDLVTDYLNERQKYTDILSDLKRQLDEAEKLAEKLPTTKDIKNWLDKIKNSGADTLTPSAKQKIIDAFIRSVYVSDEYIAIFFNTDNDPDPIDYDTYKEAINNTFDESFAPDEQFESQTVRGAKCIGTRTNSGVLQYTYYRVFQISE